jgi:preprotein translocase subunit SecD
VNLGLDLRGGAHLLAEVQVADVYADRMDALWPEVRDALRDEREAWARAPRAVGAGRIAGAHLEPGHGGGDRGRAGLARPIATLTGVGARYRRERARATRSPSP